MKYSDVIKALKNSGLYHFQKRGVAFLESRRGRAILGDEMGLGKTIQALTWLRLRQDLRPAVIIVPGSVKLKWAREANIWTPGDHAEVVFGRKAYRLHKESSLIVINYDILQGWEKQITRLEPKVLIADEHHYIKNLKADRTKAVKRLARPIPHIIGLSGTPILSRPMELYWMLYLVYKGDFMSWLEYGKKFCSPERNYIREVRLKKKIGWYKKPKEKRKKIELWDFKGASNLGELHKLIGGRMLRRLKKDVTKDLPEKTWAAVPLEMGSPQAYHEGEREWLEKINIRNIPLSISVTEKLKFIIWECKKQAVIEWVKDFLDGSEENLVLYTIHHIVTDSLMQSFSREAVRIDGRDSLTQRDKVEQQFNSKSKRLLVASFATDAKAVIGRDFKASNVAFVELGWTPGQHDQATDRCHGIGRGTGKALTIWWLVADGTIEIDIAALLDKKRHVVTRTLDGEEVEVKDLLIELIRKRRKP